MHKVRYLYFVRNSFYLRIVRPISRAIRQIVRGSPSSQQRLYIATYLLLVRAADAARGMSAGAAVFLRVILDYQIYI